MPRIVCFGEIMLRLNPKRNLRFIQADSFEASYAGSEASVAVSLSNFGWTTSFVSSLPNNELGQAAVNSLRRWGVDTTHVNRDDERLGIYFVEKGASQRPSKVIYDRQRSSLAMATLEDFDWDKIFEDTDWFHFSGITPALGDNVAEICLEACREAKRRKIKVSCDLNYRNKLWSPEKARKVMTELMEFVDILVGNEEDSEKVFGIGAPGRGNHYSSLDPESYKTVVASLKDTFGLEAVAFTLRESTSANHNRWSGILYNGQDYHISDKYNINVVDRLGGGDSFAAGLIYALGVGYLPQDAINFAVAASCLKHTIEYDFNLSSLEEVKRLLEGDGSGRIER